jgi:O-antigen ligase
MGIGPGNSGALTVGIADRVRPDSYRAKEAHSDYLGYAIERGPLGILGLIGFTVSTFLHVAGFWRHSRRGSGIASRRARLWTASMAAVLAASALHSVVIERLHFRHFWLFVALVCGSSLMASERSGDAEAEAA